jgi:uncharacterized membrane protein
VLVVKIVNIVNDGDGTPGSWGWGAQSRIIGVAKWGRVRRMYQLLLALHFLGLALGVGAGFAQFTLGLSSRELSAGERTSLALRTFSLSKNGSYGLLLLIVTGVGMMLMRGVSATFQVGGAFHAKLTLVVIMLGVLGYSQVLGARARRSGSVSELNKVRTLSRIQLVLGILVVIAATIAFK